MRKVIVIVLIVILVLGTTINAIVDQQYQEGAPFTEAYFHCADCIQILLIVIFQLISGLTLLFDPAPLAGWLEKTQAGKESESSIVTLRILGFVLLAMIFLTPHEIATKCQPVCFSFIFSR